MEKPPASSPPHPAPPCTTFVQTDAAAFKDLVQRLTGTRDQPPPPQPPLASLPRNDAATPTNNDNHQSGTTATTSSTSVKLSGAKRLHERRQGFPRPKLAIVKPVAGGGSASLPASPAILSPSMSPVASPSTTFAGLQICDIKEKAVGPAEELIDGEEEEERAIKERRFYLHPSPRSRSRSAEPELLPLFPMASPRTNEG